MIMMMIVIVIVIIILVMIVVMMMIMILVTTRLWAYVRDIEGNKADILEHDDKIVMINDKVVGWLTISHPSF